MNTQEKTKKTAEPGQKPKPRDGEQKILDPKRAEPKPAPRKPMLSDATLDNTLEDSFPASDPPSNTPRTSK